MTAVETLFDLLRERGAARHGMEAVSQLEHALQCATLAEEEGGDAALITAALLHDVGHLLHAVEDVAAIAGGNDRHQSLGSAYLAHWFGRAVAEPVALHVDAKRYLCAAEQSYRGVLSAASIESLARQGGALEADAAEAFLLNPHGRDAVRLRRWDDRAKVKGLATPPLDHFREYVAASVAIGERAAGAQPWAR